MHACVCVGMCMLVWVCVCRCGCVCVGVGVRAAMQHMSTTPSGSDHIYPKCSGECPPPLIPVKGRTHTHQCKREFVNHHCKNGFFLLKHLFTVGGGEEGEGGRRGGKGEMGRRGEGEG